MSVDGVDDVLQFIGDAAFGTTCSLFVVGQTSDIDGGIMDSVTGNDVVGLFADGSASTTINLGVGTPTSYLNGAVQSWVTRDDMHTSYATGTQNLFSATNINMNVSSPGYEAGINVWSYYTTASRQSGNLQEFIVFDNSTDHTAIAAEIQATYGI